MKFCLNPDSDVVKKLVHTDNFAISLITHLANKYFENGDFTYEEFINHKKIREQLGIISKAEVKRAIGFTIPKEMSYEQITHLWHKIGVVNDKNVQNGVKKLYRTVNLHGVSGTSWMIDVVEKDDNIDVDAKLKRREDDALVTNDKSKLSKFKREMGAFLTPTEPTLDFPEEVSKPKMMTIQEYDAIAQPEIMTAAEFEKYRIDNELPFEDEIFDEEDNIFEDDLPLQKTPSIKPGVPELFESNTELANSVYETLGFTGNIIQDNKSYYRGQIEQPTIDKNGNLVLYAKEDELYKRAGLKSKGVSMTDNLKSAIDYGNGQLEVAQNLASETYDSEKELQKLSDNGYYLIQIPKDISNEVVKEAGEVKIVGDKIIIPKGQYKIEQVIDGVESEITPEQKQQAQQLYSQYLSTIFPNSKVKDIVYHGTDANFDNFDKKYFGFKEYFGGFHFGTKRAAKTRIIESSSKNILSVLLNINNINREIDESYGQQVWDTIIKENKVKGFDGIVYSNQYEDVYKDSYIVFEPEQIHILSSKKDLEMFAEFVRNKSISPQEFSIESNLKNLDFNEETLKYLYERSSKSKDFSTFAKDVLSYVALTRSSLSVEEIIEKLNCL